MERLVRLSYCLLLSCVSLLTVGGCGTVPTEADVLQQRIMRHLDSAKLGYTNLRVMPMADSTDANDDKKMWVSLDMTGMRRLGSVEPLKGLPLTSLRLSGTNVESLRPLAGMSLVILAVDGTPVRDLSPIRGMPLKTLFLQDSRVMDLSPLEDLPLETLKFDPTRVVSGMDAIRNIQTLKNINGISASEFWRQRELGVVY